MENCYLLHQQRNGHVARFAITLDEALLLKPIMYWTQCLQEDKKKFRYILANVRSTAQEHISSRFTIDDVMAMKATLVSDRIHLQEAWSRFYHARIPHWVGVKAARWAMRNELGTHCIERFCSAANERFSRLHEAILRRRERLQPKHNESNGDLSGVVYRLKCERGARPALQYAVTRQAEATLRGLIYWIYSVKINRQEYRLGVEDRRQRGSMSLYTDEKLLEIKQRIERAHEAVCDHMAQMATLKIPNWVGNGAIQWAKNLDLHANSIGGFFTLSRYAMRNSEVER